MFANLGDPSVVHYKHRIGSNVTVIEANNDHVGIAGVDMQAEDAALPRADILRD